jgi:adenylosuccinate synthase
MSGRAIAVIGAHYGDEGKGLVVDRLVRELAAPLVVRFNGGAQAGHTVETADGRRHVFSHVGAGAFAGADTFLSRFFVAHPYIFLREIAELTGKSVRPTVIVDPRAPLTTPYEVLVNRAIETARGGARHGSCGVGFGETLQREEAGLSITVGDLDDLDRLRERLRRLRLEHVPTRLAALGLPIGDAALREDLASEELSERFVDAALAFRRQIELGEPADFVGRDVVFEGAQGLLLDQDLGAFPHVTRSRTGLPNVAALAPDFGIGSIEAFYITRTYITRHGAGPLIGELADAPYAGIVDATNQPNPFQGSLRFAHAQPELTIATIRRDIARVGLDVEVSLAVTCLDQVNGPVLCRGTDGLTARETSQFVRALAEPLAARRVLRSYGPTAATASIGAPLAIGAPDRHVMAHERRQPAGAPPAARVS